MASGGGGGGQNTVTQSQQIPAYEQQFSQQNQQLAQSLGANPYPQYNAPLVQDFSPTQQTGQQMAINAAGAYQPGLQSAASFDQLGGQMGQSVGLGEQIMAGGMTQPSYYGTGLSNISGSTAQNPLVGLGSQDVQNSLAQNPLVGMGVQNITSALQHGANDPATINSFMSPYVSQALAPQILGLQTQLGQEQNQIGAQATQANAFGDARQGAEQALQNFYGNQAISGVLGQGYNTAFSNALQAAQQSQTAGLQAGGQLMGTGTQQQQLGQQAGGALMGAGAQQQQIQQAAGQDLSNQALSQQQLQAMIGQQLGALGTQQQGLELQAGQQMGNLGSLSQQLGLQGANAVYDVGAQQQQLGQQELNTAYQQFLNQTQWPYQMLNVQESALSNSPYNITNQTTLPQANMTAQGLGAFASLAGLLGGGANGNALAPFGGQALQA